MGDFLYFSKGQDASLILVLGQVSTQWTRAHVSDSSHTCLTPGVFCTLPVAGDWVKSVVNCVIDDAPFAEGAMRMCYRMQVVSKDGTRHNVVAKVSKDPMEDRNTYFRDVQAQMCSKMWAAEFNARDVPKQIDFVPAYVYELVDRPGRPLVGVEEFVEGVFQKHNNNVGGTVRPPAETSQDPVARPHSALYHPPCICRRAHCCIHPSIHPSIHRE
jgi:hypothetical protein